MEIIEILREASNKIYENVKDLERPKGNRQARHENEVAEIHRVAGIGINAAIDNALGRVA